MSLSPADVWTRLLTQVRTQLPDHAVDTWLVPLTPVEYTDETLTLNAPDQFSVEWNESKHAPVIESMASVTSMPSWDSKAVAAMRNCCSATLRGVMFLPVPT